VTGPGGRQVLAGLTYRMGATRWPPDLTLAAMAKVERFLREDCDLSAPMILGGVPWVAADRGEDYSAALMGELGGACPRLGRRSTCLTTPPGGRSRRRIRGQRWGFR
jgi:hypothetical protein